MSLPEKERQEAVGCLLFLCTSAAARCLRVETCIICMFACTYLCNLRVSRGPRAAYHRGQYSDLIIIMTMPVSAYCFLKEDEI